VKSPHRALPLKLTSGKESTKDCADAFREWIGMGRKMTNELRLRLKRSAGAEDLRAAMVSFWAEMPCRLVAQAFSLPATFGDHSRRERGHPESSPGVRFDRLRVSP